ncbi:hypothetical protein ACH5RR_040634 [Cinchona calisaya]|uniref:Uncharacterized protein n=1 Tax=Cinchona calisaya TaxID=153742 RepID=A0ABD2XUE0_9GENT
MIKVHEIFRELEILHIIIDKEEINTVEDTNEIGEQGQADGYLDEEEDSKMVRTRSQFNANSVIEEQNGRREVGAETKPLMTHIVSALHRMTKILARRSRQRPNNSLGDDSTLGHFLKFKPTEFKGEPDDEKAEA